VAGGNAVNNYGLDESGCMSIRNLMEAGSFKVTIRAFGVENTIVKTLGEIGKKYWTQDRQGRTL
jgi:hypothetical protein